MGPQRTGGSRVGWVRQARGVGGGVLAGLEAESQRVVTPQCLTAPHLLMKWIQVLWLLLRGVPLRMSRGGRGGVQETDGEEQGFSSLDLISFLLNKCRVSCVRWNCVRDALRQYTPAGIHHLDTNLHVTHTDEHTHRRTHTHAHALSSVCYPLPCSTPSVRCPCVLEALDREI